MIRRRLAAITEIDSRILLIFLLALALALGFAMLASEMLEGETLGFDSAIITALRRAPDYAVPIGPQWLERAMIDLTALGGVTVLTLVTVLAVAYLAIKRHARLALFLGLAIGAGALAGSLLKDVFSRPRPELVLHLVQTNSLSFPSGHAMNSAIVYLTLGALLARSMADRALRIFIMAVAILLTLTIGFSRVYLGVHWPSDVIAGWSVGSAWALAMGLIAARLQQRAAIEPPSP